jgi:hypothetical protein
MESYRAEYDRPKAIATAPGATEGDLSGFLNYAKEYLQFMRSYGGDYKSIYEAVTGDVRQLGEAKDAQVAAIEAADKAAREAAAKQSALLGLVVQATTERDVARLPAIREIGDRIASPTVRFIPEYAGGGLMTRPSIGGEAGDEWAVPTYEPQRSRFLENAPPEFWENLRGAGVVQPNGGNLTVKAYFIVNDKVLGEAVAKQIPRNANLQDEIQRVAKKVVN